MPSKQMKITLDAKSVAAGAIAAVRTEMQEVADLGNDLLQLWAKAADDPDYRAYLNDLLPALKASTPLAQPGSIQHLMNSGAHGTLRVGDDSLIVRHTPGGPVAGMDLASPKVNPNPHAAHRHVSNEELEAARRDASAREAFAAGVVTPEAARIRAARQSERWPLVPMKSQEAKATEAALADSDGEPPLGEMEYWADDVPGLPPVHQPAVPKVAPRDGQFLTPADLAGATHTQVPIRVGQPAPEDNPDEQPEQLANAGTPLPVASQESVDRLLGKTVAEPDELPQEEEASELHAAASPEQETDDDGDAQPEQETRKPVDF